MIREATSDDFQRLLELANTFGASNPWIYRSGVVEFDETLLTSPPKTIYVKIVNNVIVAFISTVVEGNTALIDLLFADINEAASDRTRWIYELARTVGEYTKALGVEKVQGVFPYQHQHLLQIDVFRNIVLYPVDNPQLVYIDEIPDNIIANAQEWIDANV